MVNTIFAQVDVDEKRYIKIGELHNHYSAVGSERAWNDTYYEGLQWPADYSKTDNAIIRRTWFAIKNYTDIEGEFWDYWANYLYSGYDQKSIFPIQMEQIAKFDLPTIMINGVDYTDRSTTVIDKIDPDQTADRVVINKINTSCGITMTRKIYAFSQQYHDNYFITKYIFKNTGNVDNDDEIELNNKIEGFRFGYASRYSVCREGAGFTSGQQYWGAHSWVTRRGENYAEHLNDIANFTESTALENLEWIPSAFSWTGQSSFVNFDMIGAPNADGDGRLGSPQFAGVAVLHADSSPTDPTNDPDKIVTIGWHANDKYPSIGNLEKSDMENMKYLYDYLSGIPYPDASYGGINRMWEDNTTSIIDRVDPYTVHGDMGGTGTWFTYGSYDLEIGDSIVIVEVEGVNGISRALCEEIGGRWLSADENSSFNLPDGSSTDDKDYYKNSWVYTGMDSIMSTFSRATRNYYMDMNIPQPPFPPTEFEISSYSDKIIIQWSQSPSENNSDFMGYKIYRAIDKADTTFDLIAEINPGIYSYEDSDVISERDYYYYITAYNDGSNNTDEIANPSGSLESSRFYTKTSCPVSLISGPSDLTTNPDLAESFSLEQNYPNPFNPSTNIRYQIPTTSNVKLTIYDIRGNLIETLVDRIQDKGFYEINWNASNYSNGVYFYKIEADGFTKQNKCLLIK